MLLEEKYKFDMIRISAIKVSQPLGDFFVAKLTARRLLEISTSSVARYNEEGKIIGNQRPKSS